MYDHTFSKLANHQIKREATHKVGCQPGDCICMVPLIFLRGLCGSPAIPYAETSRDYVCKTLANKNAVVCRQGAMCWRVGHRCVWVKPLTLSTLRDTHFWTVFSGEFLFFCVCGGDLSADFFP